MEAAATMAVPLRPSSNFGANLSLRAAREPSIVTQWPDAFGLALGAVKKLPKPQWIL